MSVDAAIARIMTLNGTTVTAGIQATEGAEKAGDGEPTLLDIAIANHYGTDKIPARPWLAAAAIERRKRWAKLAARVVKAAGDGEDPIRPLRLLGAAMVGDCQESLLDGDWVPNAPMTNARKGSDQPLFDTGRLNQSHRAAIIGADGAAVALTGVGDAAAAKS